MTLWKWFKNVKEGTDRDTEREVESRPFSRNITGFLKDINEKWKQGNETFGGRETIQKGLRLVGTTSYDNKTNTLFMLSKIAVQPKKGDSGNIKSLN